MSNSHEEIYAPNIHLFAFQLREGIDKNFQLFQVPREWVDDQYQTILKEFPDLNQPFSLRTDIPKSSRFNLLEDGKQYRLFSNPLNPQTNKPYHRILLYPQQIADSYALALNIYVPQTSEKDGIKIKDLHEFNPNQCLEIETDLGKTLLLTAFLPNHESDKIDETVQKCLQSLLNLSSPEDCPPLYRKGQLFSSPILEYGNPKEDKTHILILFFSDESASKLFNKIYWELPSLLLYYHKIVCAFHNSRQDYDKADTRIYEIEKELTDFQTKQQAKTRLSATELKQLNFKIKQLLNIALEYSKLLRNLEYYQNTIAINTRNYQTKLNYLKELTQNDLDFLASFIQQESPTLQAQINADLNYFKQGTVILEQAISTIRGLVEIDQAQSDRRLQLTILAVGTGIGAAGVFSASYPLITQTNPILLPQSNLPFHPFIKSVSLSLLFGIFIYFVIEMIARLIDYLKNRGKN